MTAYEMRISDWSSDVCSSDLRIDDAIRRRFLLVIPIAPVRQFGCELLAEEARHMLAGRRKAVVDGRGDQHLDNRRLRPAEMLCVEESAVHIIASRREDDQNGKASWRERGSQYV